MTHAFIFPGQGSQAVGMLSELASSFPVVKQTFEAASTILGYDLWALCQTGPEATLNQTDKTQPALLAASVAVWRVWKQQGGADPHVMAGHSFGEYSALTCAAALEYSDAVSLAQSRGQFMQAAVPEGQGAMAAILGLEDDKIIAVCAQAAEGQVVAAVNFNAPGQVVIAGDKAAVDRAMIQAKHVGAKKAVALAVSVPAHCSLMQPAAIQMAQRLAAVTVNVPKIPVIHNVDVSAKTDAAEIRTALTEQLIKPVRWVDTVNKIAAEGTTLLFECGPGKVLTGLSKRINAQVKTLAIYDNSTLEQALKTLEESA
jgi:[acyl-carrier-protein] S-malonyltransferase